eukprot:jgi/Ulvmu1/1148/UM107_0022.1
MKATTTSDGPQSALNVQPFVPSSDDDSYVLVSPKIHSPRSSSWSSSSKAESEPLRHTPTDSLSSVPLLQPSSSTAPADSTQTKVQVTPATECISGASCSRAVFHPSPTASPPASEHALDPQPSTDDYQPADKFQLADECQPGEECPAVEEGEECPAVEEGEECPAVEEGEETEFWFADSGSDSDAETVSTAATATSDGDSGSVAAGAATEAAGSAATEAADSVAAARLVHAVLVVKLKAAAVAHGGDDEVPVRLLLSMAHPFTSPTAAAAPQQRSVCSIPFDVYTTAAHAFESAPVLPQRTPPAAAGGAATAATLTAAAAGDWRLAAAPAHAWVWQLPGTRDRRALPRRLFRVDHVWIPEGSILAIGDCNFGMAEVGFTGTCFVGGTVVVLGAACCAVFESCTFVGCSVVVVGGATATFSGCAFEDCAAPVVFACGARTTAAVCCGPREEPSHFHRCHSPLIAADGASGHVSDCIAAAATGDVFTARGTATWLTLERCTVRGVPPTPGAPRSLPTWGLSAASGASASAHDCCFEGLSGGGVRVLSGAVVTAADCGTEASRRAGFMVQSGGRLTLRQCRSTRDSREAVLAEGGRTQLHAGNLTVSAAAVDGVVVRTGAHARLSACTVSGANDTGVLAQGPGARMWLQGCNVMMCTHAGISSQHGASVDVRGGAVEWTAKDGMRVCGEGAMCTAVRCVLRFNTTAGAYIADGGVLTLRECTMAQNNEAGCYVKAGGTLRAHACEVREEVNGWLLVSGEGSTAHVRDCSVAQTGSSAVLVAKGASAVLHACILTQAGSLGASVRDRGSLLCLHACTICESVGSCVNVAHGGMAVMHATTVSNGMCHGVVVSERGELEMDGCIVQGCVEAAIRVQSAAVAVLDRCMLVAAGAQGLSACTWALLVAQCCTLEGPAVVGVLSRSGAMIVTSQCEVANSTVKFCLMETSAEHWHELPPSNSEADEVAVLDRDIVVRGCRNIRGSHGNRTLSRENRHETAADEGVTDTLLRDVNDCLPPHAKSVLIIDDGMPRDALRTPGSEPQVERWPETTLVKNRALAHSAHTMSELQQQLSSDRKLLKCLVGRAVGLRGELPGAGAATRQAAALLGEVASELEWRCK